MLARIVAPVEGLNGPGVGGIVFTDSVAETDNQSIVDYCLSTEGYTVQFLDLAPEPQPVDADGNPILPPADEPREDTSGNPVNPILNALPPLDKTVPLPKANGSKADWVEFAGLDEETAKSLTRDEIRDSFTVTPIANED